MKKSLRDRLERLEEKAGLDDQTIVVSTEVDGEPCTELQRWKNGNLVFVRRIVGVRAEDV